MKALLALLLFLQVPAPADIADLQNFLGKSYRTVLDLLGAKNQILLKNTERLAPAQAEEMKARWKAPETVPVDRPVFPVSINNVGQGLLSFLFEDDFIAEQVNFIFCPPQGATTMDGVALSAQPERVITLQVLFDDSRAVGPQTQQLLQNVYGLPAPIPPGAAYQHTLRYPLREGLPFTTWDLGNSEVVYQRVTGAGVITGQLWITSKPVVATCVNLPRVTP